MRADSLLEKHNHWVSYVKTDIAPIVMCDAVAALFNDKTMPIALELPIKFVFNLTSNVREMSHVMVFKCFQSRDNCMLDLIDTHVRPFD